ncbi:MAG: hypothetical protein M9958_00905 [Chitinophagales bacterium]|nr:hypothetical protein [Chitinophagales bacterium]
MKRKVNSIVAIGFYRNAGTKALPQWVRSEFTDLELTWSTYGSKCRWYTFHRNDR